MVGLEFLEEREQKATPSRGAFNRVGGRPGVAAAAGCLCRWFLEKWVARGHAGRVGEAVAIWKPHQEPGHTLPPPQGKGASLPILWQIQ